MVKRITAPFARHAAAEFHWLELLPAAQAGLPETEWLAMVFRRLRSGCGRLPNGRIRHGFWRNLVSSSESNAASAAAPAAGNRTDGATSAR